VDTFNTSHSDSSVDRVPDPPIDELELEDDIDSEEENDTELLWHLFAATAPPLIGIGLLTLAAMAAIIVLAFG
jgi:hypothetical protein